MNFNDTFYPTPKHLIDRMLSKKTTAHDYILEPSAGKGDIIEAYKEKYHYNEMVAIEKDKNLRSILRDKKIKVIDSDFLLFSGPDKFDLIIANPPFNEGDKHLLKAIDIMYNGQIIFLLNAETIKNPYSNTRKQLVKKLEELNAEIEFIQDAFVNAERKTKVEVALINIMIKNDVEKDLFDGCNEQSKQFNEEIKQKHEVSTGKNVKELVAEYNEIINLCTKTIIEYFKNYRKVNKYIILNQEINKYYNTSEDITKEMSKQVNEMIIAVRKDFWERTLELKELKNRMTKKKKDEFRVLVQQRSNMDFTENNIRNFVLNIIESYEDILNEAVESVFDKFTIKHCWDETPELREKNVHYYNGWKTNKAWKCGEKVIYPLGYGGLNTFIDWSGNWRLDYSKKDILNDFDIVMNYFDGMSEYTSIVEAIDEAFAKEKTSGIESTYFIITCYKKGTIHLKFKNKDILRRFNIAASKSKNWLPNNYGKKSYNDFTEEEKSVIESFQGRKDYEKRLNLPLYEPKKNLIQIEM